ncbi:hypothetical protein C7437_1011049 [Psychrobacillus insolitus]|uniref:Uncharacterized protein n=1 Tax=Psychrobacillus insolitus TaxID=1461 RepID=A0A2W7ML84_9BACI|nr:hypothetical protein [Psychrobacillus insolitus]PZX07927.1 hypothetical protein C7437_1011049 [Psychrobacillus insolitus]
MSSVGTFKKDNSKPVEEILENARIINVITSHDATLKNPHEIAFVVSKFRSYEDYKQVVRHEACSKNPQLKHGAYSEHLLSAMFKGW